MLARTGLADHNARLRRDRACHERIIVHSCLCGSLEVQNSNGRSGAVKMQRDAGLADERGGSAVCTECEWRAAACVGPLHIIRDNDKWLSGPDTVGKVECSSWRRVDASDGGSQDGCRCRHSIDSRCQG